MHRAEEKALRGGGKPVGTAKARGDSHTSRAPLRQVPQGHGLHHVVGFSDQGGDGGCRSASPRMLWQEIHPSMGVRRGAFPRRRAVCEIQKDLPQFAQVQRI